jgi:dihydrofolate reductase
MRKVVLLEHISLDGYIGGTNGEMDWVKLCDEQWQRVTEISNTADAALYGRVTFQMMESYWPTAGEQPGASQHDKDHSNWLKDATKLVVSKTLTASDWKGTRFISGDASEAIAKIKQEPGKNIFLLGSPTLVRELDAHGLIDDYWLYLNPTALGSGLPIFAGKTTLKLVESKALPTGVVELHYEKAS